MFVVLFVLTKLNYNLTHDFFFIYLFFLIKNLTKYSFGHKFGQH